MRELREKIFQEIEKERSYQDAKWGTDFDDKNNLNDWVAFMTQYSGQAVNFTASKEEQRLNLLKAVSIGIAALERFDNNKGFPDRHYEK